MMNKFNILFILFLTAFLLGCEDQITSEVPVSGASDNIPVSIMAGASFPEMDYGVFSRAMGDEPTVDELLNSLKVNLFVFDASGVMLQYIGPEDISIVNIDPVSKHVYFKVSNIYSSSRPRRLHFVITSAEDLHDVTGGEYISAMASETTTMPALVVANGTDAYWGIKELDSITENMELTVKLIRNFVKMTVKSTVDENVFRLLGYTVVNRPGKGTVVPYIYKDHLFASFLNSENDLISYDDIIAQGYFGVNPSGSDENMTHTTDAEVMQALQESESRLAAGEPDTPCYIYERSQSGLISAGSEVMVTYMIIVGEYRGKRCYYKIDIGKDKDGKFGFYDLLRNFQYTVEITEVGGEGAPTLIDAMNGAAHNNLSTSVVTRDLFSIGYNGEIIEVSSTRVIFTERTVDYSLRFRYTTPSGVKFDPSKLKIYNISDEAVEFDVSGVSQTQNKSIDLDGEVIENAVITLGDEGWYELKVSTNSVPVDSRRLEQNIRIYYSGGTAGLGRTITFILRKPWDFIDVVSTDPTSALGSTFSINLTVPPGLSQSQFPIIITFESDKQNIYALNGSQLSVTTGKSGFIGATTDDVISYEWRIEWTDYMSGGNVGGARLNAQFGMNTTSAEDRAYNTQSIDDADIAGRSSNNGRSEFCVRIANYGQKYLQPYYVNISRN